MMSTTKIKTLICVTAVAVMFGAGCNRKTDAVVTQEDIERILIPVTASTAANRDVTRTLNFSGNIDAFRRAAIAPALQGARVQRIFVNEGEQVREGQLLARMEDFQLRQAAAQLEQLDADRRRMESLVARGTVTAQQYEQILAAFNAAKAGHDLLRNSVELRAPFAGTIIGRNANEGEMFTGAPGADGSMGLMSVAQMGRMKIEIMAPEQDFVLLRPGQVAHVRVDAYPDTVFEGTIFTVNPALNRMSRTSRVTIEIMNNRQLLRPGMFARTEIVISNLSDVLAVPSTAVITRNDAPHVFTVEVGANDVPPFATMPKLVPVKIGMITNEFTQILEGITAGTTVLTDNNVSLSENTNIRVMAIR